jgi:Rieske Fe-S protein
METPPQTPSDNDSPTDDAADSRRGFLAEAVALALGAVTLIAPAAVGVVAFLNPLRMRSRGGDYMKLTSLEVLPEDGTPRRFPVIADRTDAWNYFPNEAIGAVFLRRTGQNEVSAFQVVCPHAGCAIQYQESPEGGKFTCPCHTADFDLGGKRLGATSPSPRDMDSLETKIEENGEVFVKFETFETGTSKKVATG